jgi:hypothetical protein
MFVHANVLPALTLFDCIAPAPSEYQLYGDTKMLVSDTDIVCIPLPTRAHVPDIAALRADRVPDVGCDTGAPVRDDVPDIADSCDVRLPVVAWVDVVELSS